MEHLKDQISLLPQKPGVYLYYNKDGAVIYVGKAKKLKNRVYSYFNKQHESGKTKVLVKNIRRVEHFVVDSEEDALLLENNLIKRYKPRYNILLKDDKTYPWICVKNEDFPRVFKTRTMLKDGSSYFGPYASVYFVDLLIDLIKKLYPIRTCNLKLTYDSIVSNKFKPCLEYHLKNCKGPCIGEERLDDYNQYILHIKSILNGNISEVKQFMKKKMILLSEELRFEEAQSYKEKWNLLNSHQKKSTVVSRDIKNVDVFSFVDSEESSFINYLKIVNGSVIQTKTLEFKKKMNESKEELIQLAIAEIKQSDISISSEIIVPFDPQIELKNIKFTVPQRGSKLKLLELSQKNAKYYKLEQLKHDSDFNKEQREIRVLSEMKKDLHLKYLPKHIECFDNSNIQGTSPVASCVVFINAKPCKKEYRQFNVKTVEGANDFATMEEIIYRRYKRLLEEERELPQLIVVDGGKGQLNAALNSLEKLELRGKIAIIGIAKRLEELYFPGDSTPLYLKKSSETLKVIQHLRDEAHRFGIAFHRKKRSQKFLNSELDEINGIGVITKRKLLEHFISTEQIRNKSFEELSLCVGSAKAKILSNYFNKN